VGEALARPAPRYAALPLDTSDAVRSNEFRAVLARASASRLRAQVFPPSIREPPPPALDLFDLDDHFASERVRLAHLTNKCSEDDLDYYIREAGAVLGVTGSLPPDRRDARYVLQHVFLQIVEWKKLNQEPEAMERFRKLNGVSK